MTSTRTPNTSLVGYGVALPNSAAGAQIGRLAPYVFATAAEAETMAGLAAAKAGAQLVVVEIHTITQENEA